MFSFCHLLYRFALNYSRFISMAIRNEHALAGPSSLFPVSAAEEGKAMWYLSAEPSASWKLISCGGVGGINFQPNQFPDVAHWAGRPASVPVRGGRTGARSRAGWSCSCLHVAWLRYPGSEAIWRKARRRFSFNPRGKVFLSKEKSF